MTIRLMVAGNLQNAYWDWEYERALEKLQGPDYYGESRWLVLVADHGSGDEVRLNKIEAESKL